MKTPLSERFWSKVQRGDGCWLWLASPGTHGYGQINVDRRPISAHRVAWQLARGPIPEGGHICHSCDRPGCVRVTPLRADGTPDPTDHLFLSTNAGNMADMARKLRGAKHLRPHQVVRAHAMYDAGRSVPEIAAAFGVSDTSIKALLRGDSWSTLHAEHVPPGIPIKEAAARLGVGRAGLVSQIRRGMLRATRYGSRWYVTEAEVERYRAENKGNYGVKRMTPEEVHAAAVRRGNARWHPDAH